MATAGIEVNVELSKSCSILVLGFIFHPPLHLLCSSPSVSSVIRIRLDGNGHGKVAVCSGILLAYTIEIN